MASPGETATVTADDAGLGSSTAGGGRRFVPRDPELSRILRESLAAEVRVGASFAARYVKVTFVVTERVL